MATAVLPLVLLLPVPRSSGGPVPPPIFGPGGPGGLRVLPVPAMDRRPAIL